MHVIIYAKPGAKEARVEEVVPQKTYRIWIDAPAKEDAANYRLIELLARHLGLPKSCLSIVRGSKRKTKHIKINCQLKN
ncbi:MAG: DUF167 domain-containing protein [Parcubacteria group bacterium]|nr:DUF167 domain-containing protein [Parcubacteria group bacterium]